MATIRATWSGVIGFGMVAIPVKMGRATVDESQSMHQVHIADGGRIRYKKVCETCGEEIDQSQIGRGAEVATGETVALSAADMESLPGVTKKRADVMYFCDADEIDPVATRSSYYLWPDTGGAPAYRLLLGALEESGKVAVVNIAIRSRESLAVIVPRNGALMLVTLFWPAEVREPDFVPKLEETPEPPAAQAKMAASLIAVATQAFDPEQHEDAYSKAVRALVDSRAAIAPKAGSGAAAAMDLTEMLKTSIADAREARKAQPRKRQSKAKAGAS